MNELELIAQRIEQAKHPEEVFGTLEGVDDPLKAGRSVYRSLSKLTHPDLYLGSTELSLAEVAFKRLAELWEAAQLKIKAGTYGEIPKDVTDAIIIKTRKREYQVFEQILQGDFTNIYRATYQKEDKISPVLFKVVRDTADNDFAENEARILQNLALGKGHEKFGPYVPHLVESFRYQDETDKTRRQVNILSVGDKPLYTFQEVHQVYPDGIHPKDMAWIWRRMLVGLGFAHLNQVFNGEILPQNIFIHPGQKPGGHGLVIGDWSYAVTKPAVSGERISAINTAYEGWYPEEILKKDIPTQSTDIYMGAKNMVYLLGGDPISGALPESIDRRLRTHLRDCMLPHKHQRLTDAWVLLQEFDQLLEELWGPRAFHPFMMPKRETENPFR